MDPNNPLAPMPVSPQPVPPMPVTTPPVQLVPPAPQPMANIMAPVPPMNMNETQTSANSMPPLAPVLPTTPVSSEQIVTPTKKGGGGVIKFFLFLVIVLVLGAGGVGGYIYYNNLTKLSQSPDTTDENSSETTEEDSEDLESLQVLDTQIATAPETTNFQDTEYGFSIDYLSSWDFECITCNEIPESSASAWTVLQMQTFDYALNEEDKIASGAQLRITARSVENGSDTIDELIKQKTGYSKSTYLGIEGALNLDPSQPYQGFIYTDRATGLDIHLEWKSLSNRDRADKELQTILKSFKKI